MRTAWTWLLLAVWTGLMACAVLSTLDPPWLQELTRPAKDSEMRIYKNHGDAALRRKQYGTAAEYYSLAMKIAPSDPTLWTNLGKTYIQRGLTTEGAWREFTDQGVECLQTALKYNPSERLAGEIHYDLGDVDEQRKRPVEALEHYLAAAEHGMRKDVIYRKIGDLYLRLNRLEDARVAFEELLAAQEDPLVIYADMFPRSEVAYADEPDHLAAIEQLKGEFRATGDLACYDWTMLRERQKTDRNIANTHDRLAFIYANQKRFDLALLHREKFLEIWPDNQAAVRQAEELRKLLIK